MGRSADWIASLPHRLFAQYEREPVFSFEISGQLWELDEQYGFRQSEIDYPENFLGMSEKWMRAAKESDNW